MTTEMETWLMQATCGLSKNSLAQVRTEILEHCESAQEAGLSAEEVVAALGDPKVANRQYRHVLLTSTEARLLRDGNWEAGAVCSRPWIKWLLLAIPAAVLCVSAGLFLTGKIAFARDLFIGGLTMGLWFAAPFLPIYTPWRGRAFRLVKWLTLFGAMVLVFNASWLLASCLWPLALIEWTRVSIRRKLPIAQWPKQLYL